MNSSTTLLRADLSLCCRLLPPQRPETVPLVVVILHEPMLAMRSKQRHAPECLCEGAAWQDKSPEHSESTALSCAEMFPVLWATVLPALCMPECTLEAVILPDLRAESILSSSSKACAFVLKRCSQQMWQVNLTASKVSEDREPHF